MNTAETSKPVPSPATAPNVIKTIGGTLGEWARSLIASGAKVAKIKVYDKNGKRLGLGVPD